MSIHPKDVLFYAGGECFQKFGVPYLRQTRAQSGVLTFTRSGAVGSFVGPDGNLRQSSANRIRTSWIDSDADGTVDTPTILLEPASTNEFTRSEALDNAAWTKNAATITADQATGPDGVASLDEIVEDGTTDGHRVIQAVTGMTADANYAMSGFFIAGGRTWVQLFFRETAAAANFVRAWFNLATGVVGTSDDGGTGTLVRAYVEDWTHVAAGLYRCVLVGSVGNSATAIQGAYQLATADEGGDYAGDGSSSLYAGYCQLEDDVPAASSYIPTTTAAASRSAETFSTDWAHAPQAMTLYLKFIERGSIFQKSGAPSGVLSIGGASGARFQVYESGGVYRVEHSNGTSAITADLAASPTIMQPVELRAVLNADGSIEIGQSIDGAAATTASTATVTALADSWNAATLWLNSMGATNRGLNGFEAIKGFTGVRTMAECRAVYPFEAAS